MPAPKMLPLRKTPVYQPIDSVLNGRKVRFATNPNGPVYVIIRVHENKTVRNQTPEDYDWEKLRKFEPSISATIAPVLEDGTLGKMEYAYVRLTYIEQPSGTTHTEDLLEWNSEERNRIR
jgi:hypothetical protein